MVLVEHRDAVVDDGAAQHLELRILLDAGDLVGRHVADEVELAGQQAVDAGRDLGHHHDAHALQRRATAPIIVVGIEGQRLVGYELAHLVGAGRDRRARPVEPALGLVEAAARDDVAAQPADTPFHRHVGRAVDEAHRVLVDGLDLLEGREQALGHGGDFRRQVLALDRIADEHRSEQRPARGNVVVRPEHTVAAEGEDHVVGRHLVAVMELHALAQGEFDGAVVDALPALGESRDLLQPGEQVLHDQALEHEGEDALADIGLLAQRLKCGAVGDLLHGDGDGGAAVGLPDCDPRQAKAGGGEARCGDQSTAAQKHDVNPLEGEGGTLGRFCEREVSVR